MSAQNDDLRDSGGWYACSQAYLHLKFGVDVWEHPYGIGDCVIPFELACECYFNSCFLHPIAHGELVWAIMSALLDLFEAGSPTEEQLDLAKQVVHDAQKRPWAIGAIGLHGDINEQIDPGSHRMDQWLRKLEGVDFEAMQRLYDEYFRNKPFKSIQIDTAIVGPYITGSEQRD